MRYIQIVDNFPFFERIKEEIAVALVPHLDNLHKTAYLHKCLVCSWVEKQAA
jgi:hypothetical protein